MRSEVVEETPATSEQGEKIKAELDDLLDEIDEVLESSAEEFVKSYVQKGWRVGLRRPRPTRSRLRTGASRHPGRRPCRFPARPTHRVTASVTGWGLQPVASGPMTLPTFRADDDPGPSFLDVLRRSGAEPRWVTCLASTPSSSAPRTTVVPSAYADGVVMAGDRRATPAT